jgi:prevent-host-death family protein
MMNVDSERKATAAGELMVQSDEARRGFADLLARAGHKDERVVITLYGREHAALIGMKDLERLRALDAA